MIVKKTKQLGNFKRGINLYVPRRSSSAPSGIPVASTTSIIITGDVSYLGTYARVSQPNNITNQNSGEADYLVFNGGTYLYRNPNQTFGQFDFGATILFAPNSIVKDGGGAGSNTVGTPYGYWALVSLAYDSEGFWFEFVRGTNPSTDSTTIPTSGWTGGVTITAA